MLGPVTGVWSGESCRLSPHACGVWSKSVSELENQYRKMSIWSQKTVQQASKIKTWAWRKWESKPWAYPHRRTCKWRPPTGGGGLARQRIRLVKWGPKTRGKRENREPDAGATAKTLSFTLSEWRGQLLHFKLRETLKFSKSLCLLDR